MSIGGAGGASGDGGAVTFANTGRIATSGDGSTAVFLQSVGGGGGAGGNAGGGTITVGGTGGASGDGGAVTATNTGAIQTAGEQAVGIFAQSVGGGGGTGGSVGSSPTSLTDIQGDDIRSTLVNALKLGAAVPKVVAEAKTIATNYSVQSVSVGGFGGSAGNGGYRPGQEQRIDRDTGDAGLRYLRAIGRWRWRCRRGGIADRGQSRDARWWRRWRRRRRGHP